MVKKSKVLHYFFYYLMLPPGKHRTSCASNNKNSVAMLQICMIFFLYTETESIFCVCHYSFRAFVRFEHIFRSRNHSSHFYDHQNVWAFSSLCSFITLLLMLLLMPMPDIWFHSFCVRYYHNLHHSSDREHGMVSQLSFNFASRHIPSVWWKNEKNMRLLHFWYFAISLLQFIIAFTSWIK